MTDWYDGDWRRVYRPLPWQRAGLQQTASGYGARLTSSSVAVFPDGRVRRIYVTQYSNGGSAWVMLGGRRIYLCEPSS